MIGPCPTHLAGSELWAKGIGNTAALKCGLNCLVGKGYGPIWMLPTDQVYGGWAASGEIDIVEAVNLSDQESKRIHGTLHYGREWPGQASSGTHYIFNNSDPMKEFHTYALEWSKREMRWYVDDLHYATQKSSGWYSQIKGEDGFFENVPGDAPFDQRFHLLMNVAVGGNWPGAPDQSTRFPVEMEVDYVRVFSCPEDPETLRSCATKNRSATRVLNHLLFPELFASNTIKIYLILNVWKYSQIKIYRPFHLVSMSRVAVLI